MEEKRPIYVLDTNVLVDYPDIIPGENVDKPKNPTIDFAGAHLVIPSAVVRELSSFKRESSDRGRVARKLLKRLRGLTKKDKSGKWWWSYKMDNPIVLSDDGLTLSILPVHKDFKRSLPFSPSEEDMDGQIILAAISASYITFGKSNDGKDEALRNEDEAFKTYSGRRVIVLTNDNGLAIRAHERGIATDRFGYECQAPYTGRRDLVVPNELFKMLYFGRRVERADFERLMPEEPKLVANEFIVMKPENNEGCSLYDPDCDPFFTNVGRYDYYEEAILPLKFVPSFPVTPQSVGQAIYAEALADSNISAVICRGPAGSGKTYMATIYGYMACRIGQYINVAVIPCEGTHKLGALPGDLDDKMDPQVQPLKDAIRNYLLKEDPTLKRELTILRKYGASCESEIELLEKECQCEEEPTAKNGTEENGNAKSRRKKRREGRNKNGNKKSIKTMVDERVNLIWRNWFSVLPIENARGKDFALQLAIYDEFQDQNISQADTLLKRIGANGKIVITGDIEQIHAPYLDETNNGLVYASSILYDDPMVAQVCFAEEDVVRHPLVKLIAERQRKAKSRNEDA